MFNTSSIRLIHVQAIFANRNSDEAGRGVLTIVNIKTTVNGISHSETKV